MSDFCKNCNPHSYDIIPPPLVNVWLIFDLQKYVNCFEEHTSFVYGSTASCRTMLYVKSSQGSKRLYLYAFTTCIRYTTASQVQRTFDLRTATHPVHGFTLLYIQHACTTVVLPTSFDCNTAYIGS